MINLVELKENLATLADHEHNAAPDRANAASYRALALETLQPSSATAREVATVLALLSISAAVEEAGQ